MAKKIKKKSHPEKEISLHLSNFSKEVKQLKTDRHKNVFQSLGNDVRTSKECLQKISEKYLLQDRIYPYIGLKSVSKPTNGLTDIQKICECLELVYKCLRNVSKNF